MKNYKYMRYGNLLVLYCALLFGISLIGSTIYYILSIPISQKELFKNLYVALLASVFFILITTITGYTLHQQKKGEAENFKKIVLPNITSFIEYLRLTGHGIFIILTIFGTFLFPLLSWLTLHDSPLGLGIKNPAPLLMFILIIGIPVVLVVLSMIVYYSVKRDN